jgi:transcriptional/translational regulatory protein YebC/TACO1
MEIVLEAGADDVLASEQGFEVRCDVHAFDKVAQALEQKGIKADSAEIAYIPTTTVAVTDRGVAATLQKLHDALEENEDVQVVFSNDEIDDVVAAHGT